MYPYDIIPGLDLYGILLCVGILAAMITFRICADRLRLGARVQNFTLLVAGASVVVGYFFAILQSHKIQSVGVGIGDLVGRKYDLRGSRGEHFPDDTVCAVANAGFVQRAVKIYDEFLGIGIGRLK